MGIFHNLFRSRPEERKPTNQEPVATASDVSAWNNFLQLGDAHHREVAQAYRRIYRSGGIVRTAVDSYGLFMFSGGWELQSDDANEAVLQDIKDTVFSRSAEFNAVISEATQDAICIGDGYAKILHGTGRLSRTPVGLQHIPAERVKAHIDETLAIQWFDLYDERITQIIGRLDPAEILHVVFHPGGGGTINGGLYGVGLLESAWDDIKHDVEVSEGTAAAIRRHGYGIWHARVSSTDPERPVSRSEIEVVKNSLQKISARSEIVTSANIEIVPLNETGQTAIGQYSEWTVTRLCTALGIPGELLGLRQGSTDATAVTRIENFYKKIQTYQQTLAHAINTQFIDRILQSFGKPAGSVWIEYADPSPEDNIKRSQYVAGISAITPGDPFAIMSQQQMQTYLGIDHDQWAKDETTDAEEMHDHGEQTEPLPEPLTESEMETAADAGREDSPNIS